MVGQLAQRFGGHARVDDEDVGAGRNERYRDKVALDVVGHFRQKRVDRSRPDVSDHKAVAVGRLLRSEIHSDRSRCARLAFDDHSLPPDFAELLAEDPRHQVRASPGRVGDDKLDRLYRIRLGECAEGEQRRGQPESKDEQPAHSSSVQQYVVRFWKSVPELAKTTVSAAGARRYYYAFTERCPARSVQSTG